MKNYILVFLVLAVSFLLSLNTVKFFDVQQISLFLTVIGLLYGLIAAFTISNSWERFSKIRDLISEETSNLMNCCILSEKMSDKQTYQKLKQKILDYANSVPKIEWKDYWNDKKTHKKFREVLETFSEFRIKDQKEAVLFEIVGDEIKSASTARTAQLVLSQNKLSKLQWTLNTFLSVVLLSGIIFLNIPFNPASIFIIAAMCASIIMVLLVTYELDSMKIAEEEVSNKPYFSLVEFIKESK